MLEESWAASSAVPRSGTEDSTMTSGLPATTERSVSSILQAHPVGLDLHLAHALERPATCVQPIKSCAACPPSSLAAAGPYPWQDAPA